MLQISYACCHALSVVSSVQFAVEACIANDGSFSAGLYFASDSFFSLRDLRRPMGAKLSHVMESAFDFIT